LKGELAKTRMALDIMAAAFSELRAAEMGDAEMGSSARGAGLGVHLAGGVDGERPAV
jgi:hypothetical protein